MVRPSHQKTYVTYRHDIITTAGAVHDVVTVIGIGEPPCRETTRWPLGSVGEAWAACACTAVPLASF